MDTLIENRPIVFFMVSMAIAGLLAVSYVGLSEDVLPETLSMSWTPALR